MEKSFLPENFLLSNLVRGICFENAKAYFGLECGAL